MSPTHDAIGKLQRPLIAAIGSILLATSTILWSSKELQHARQEKSMALQHRNTAEQQLGQATADSGTIRERAASFRHLQESGIVGEEQREQWVARLADIEQERLPLHMQYALGTKERLNVSKANKPGFASRLHLQLELRHTADLLDLLARIEHQLTALSAPQRCQLTRQEAPGAGLEASCDIDLITLLAKEKQR